MFVRLWIVPVLLAIALSGCGEVENRPNIVFILTDDQRADCLGAMGNDVIQTPNLDQLAAEGTLFRNAFVTTSICSVSRASILLGQEARTSRIRNFARALNDEQHARTYSSLLGGSGYFTGFIGKWGVGADDLDEIERAAEEFDFWAGFSHQGNFWHDADCAWIADSTQPCDCPTADGRPGYQPRIGRDFEEPTHLTHDVLPAKLDDFLDVAGESDAPFCLSVFMKAPHGPWEEWHHDLAPLYDNVEYPTSPSVNEAHALEQPPFLREMLEAKRGLEFASDPGRRAEWLRHYYRQVTALDEFVGQVRERLRARGMAEDTIIVFASDNGHLMGEHGAFGKWLMYEESIRIPVIVHDPRHPENAGQVRDQMVLNTDLAPTIMELGGVDVPAEMDGQSLVPLLSNPDMTLRDHFYYEHYFSPPAPLLIPRIEGIRTQGWKYVRYPEEAGPYEQLFDLQQDPHEMTNLATDPAHHDKLEELRTIWDAEQSP